MTNANDTHNTFDTRVNRPNPDHRGPPVTGAVNPQAIGVYFWQRAEKRYSGLHVRHTTIRREATTRASAFSPALIIKRQHHIAGFV